MNVVVPRPAFRAPASDGVFGVIGNELVDGDPRLVALLMGRKIPEPAIEVVKYETLVDN